MDPKIEYHTCRGCLAMIPYIGVRPAQCNYCLLPQNAAASSALQNPPPPQRRQVQVQYDDCEEESHQGHDYDIERLAKAVKINLSGADKMKFGDAMGQEIGFEPMPARKGLNKTQFKQFKKRMNETTYLDYDDKSK